MGWVVRNARSHLSGPGDFEDHLEQERVWSLSYRRNFGEKTSVLGAGELIKRGETIRIANGGGEFRRKLRQTTWFALRCGIGRIREESISVRRQGAASVAFRSGGQTYGAMGIALGFKKGPVFWTLDLALDGLGQPIDEVTAFNHGRFTVLVEFR